MISRRAVLAGAVAFGAASIGGRAAAAPASELLEEHWRGSGDDPGPDHSEWTFFIGAWRRMGADGVARFDYANAVHAFNEVGDYVAMLQRQTPTRMTRDAAFAYWANLYNATTVMLVLADYPVDSIKEVRGGLFNTGPWAEKVVRVEGRELSLDDVEHGIMRPVLRDPRVHYAVNCASIGCPNLPALAWRAETLGADLDAAAREFVNHPRGARVDRRGRLTVSSIYSWFEEDFGDTEEGVIRHLRQYADPELLAALDGVDEIYDDEYDWSLNDV